VLSFPESDVATAPFFNIMLGGSDDEPALGVDDMVY
jgi:hypothetical protein